MLTWTREQTISLLKAADRVPVSFFGEPKGLETLCVLFDGDVVSCIPELSVYVDWESHTAQLRAALEGANDPKDAVIYIYEISEDQVTWQYNCLVDLEMMRENKEE